MQAMLEAIRPAPGVGASLAMSAGWVFGVLIGAIGLLAFFAGAAPRYWHTYVLGDSGLSVEMPYRPVTNGPSALASGEVERLQAGSRHFYEVSVWKTPLPGSAPGEETVPSQGTMTAPTAVTIGSFHGSEGLSVARGRTCKMRRLQNDRFLVMLAACAPRVEPEMDRFLLSLHER
jgi:hypothetical protein